jgi:hypothetical protein
MLRRVTQLLTILVTILSGCDHHSAGESSRTLRAYATGEVDKNGNVRHRESTSDEMAQLDAQELKNAEIDRRYPSPEIPKGVTPLKAIRISPPGIVELADTRTIRLDGVTCSDIGVAFLSRLLIDPETFLIVVPTAPVSDQATPADVWTVEGLGSGTVGYSSPVETALKNGWCDVQPNSSSKRKVRYAAIVAAFRKERRDFGENAR